jgi:LPXTG-site transpeptidase (sortase) family protein
MDGGGIWKLDITGGEVATNRARPTMRRPFLLPWALLAAVLGVSATIAAPPPGEIAPPAASASMQPGVTADLSPQRAHEVATELGRLAHEPDTGAVLGRIEIPRVGVSAVIREGVDDVTIRRGVGHFPTTPLVYEGGNTALAAHRTTDFRGLRNIRTGDKVTVTTPNGTFRYVVRRTFVVRPEEVWVLGPTAGPALTLVTCYPFDYHGPAPERFVVRATRAPQEPQRAPVRHATN